MIIQGNSAYAVIKGGKDYPDIRGTVTFLQTAKGVMVNAKIYGLPTQHHDCVGGVFAFHIHSGDSCTGTPEDQFANAGGHYNPTNCPHPYHAGDLPPLFSNDGFAGMQVLTNRVTVNELIGKTIIIHSDVDDFTSQPSGNSGKKIACGIIERQ